MIEWNKVKETEDTPKMIEVYLEQAWQDAFCYALAVEEPEKDYLDPKLLLTIISGNDSTLQSMKAAIDIGSGSLYFGHGKKGLTAYRFVREFRFGSEKGAYDKFPITINNNRKAVAIVHEDLLGGNSEYILSFDGDPAEDVRQVLGGGKYGLHILPQWKDTIFRELSNRGHIEDIEFYYDTGIFPKGFSLMKLNIEEEEADELVSQLIREGKLSFPKVGTGSELGNVSDLTTYMQNYVNDMVAKISDQVTPTHNPLQDEAFEGFKDYKRQLFPVQAHVSTAIAKRLKEQKAFIIQGEMSTGKTSMLVSLTDAHYRMKGRKGYFACVMVPPSLTKKWPEEIKEIIPTADVHVIDKTEQLIKFHNQWTYAGRPKPQNPTFFVVSFTTMRGDCVIDPAVDFIEKATHIQKGSGSYYRYGFYCPDCGCPQHVIENKRTELDENGEEKEVVTKRVMKEDEFGNSRRLQNATKPANAFCSECGGSLWTKRVPNRYSSFKEWTRFEKKLSHAAKEGNPKLVQHIQENQEELPKVVGRPRRLATIEYIRRRMKNFFDIALVDEIHELKGGMTAQGNSLGSLVASSKKAVGGTGTLFGGKAGDVYYLLWRLFPHEMIQNGFKYSDVRKWNEEFGNIETTTVNFEDKGEYSNKQSRGGTKRTEKVLPGISPFVFGKFLVQNTALVRLVDVWPDPVELVNVPTILVDMEPELKGLYNDMVRTFESQIQTRDDGHKLYLPLTNNGIAYPDNPFTYPDILYKNESGNRELVWKAKHLDPSITLNKEKKLQEIIQGELDEGRKSIVYVRDTGSSVEGRDVRPRLKKVLEDIGAKVAILDTSSTKTNRRSEWLRKKIEQEGYDVVIVSQELVRVGLDLLCTPTLIFYQFSWSLFTINQASRRAWRIGQNEECRLYYLAYKDSYQEQMAELIAMKNKAASAINGEVSSDGLSAMLGDEGDLQSMLIKSIKNGDKLKGSTEEWVAQTSDRAREILAGIGKKKQLKPSVKDQYMHWVKETIEATATKNVLIRRADVILSNIEKGNIAGFSIEKGVLEVDFIAAFGMDMVADGVVLSHLTSAEREEKVSTSTYDVTIIEVKEGTKKRKKKTAPIEGQLAFELF